MLNDLLCIVSLGLATLGSYGSSRKTKVVNLAYIFKFVNVKFFNKTPLLHINEERESSLQLFVNFHRSVVTQED